MPNWRKTGVWEQLNAALREAVREQAECEAEPSAAVLYLRTNEARTLTRETGAAKIRCAEA